MTDSTTATTPEELAAIRDRANAATEGPWLYRPHKMDDWGTIRIADAEEPWFVARAQAGGPVDHGAHRAAGTDPYRHNGEFIARARTDVPRLLDLIDAQAAQLAELTAERDAAHKRGYDARQAEIVRALEEAGGRIVLTHGPASVGMVTLTNERAEAAEAALAAMTAERDKLHHGIVEFLDIEPLDDGFFPAETLVEELETHAVNKYAEVERLENDLVASQARETAMREYVSATEYWKLEPHDQKERAAFLAKIAAIQPQEPANG